MSQPPKKYNETVAYVRENKNKNGSHLAVKTTMEPGVYIIQNPLEEIDKLVKANLLDVDKAAERKEKLKGVLRTVVKINE